MHYAQDHITQISHIFQLITLVVTSYAAHAAMTLNDLTSPPANRLEKLRGDRAGQHSIRVNDQYRICFRWYDGNAYDVEIVDYH